MTQEVKPLRVGKDMFEVYVCMILAIDGQDEPRQKDLSQCCWTQTK